MFYNKCAFRMNGGCWGNEEHREYEKPFIHYYWPIIYVCENHKYKEVTWIDAINSKSNVLMPFNKMTHTKELSKLQALEMWIGNCEEITFCFSCNGTGEDGDNIEAPIICKKCKGTGRKECS